MLNRRALLGAAGAAALAGCATAPPGDPGAALRADAGAALRALMDATDEAFLDRHPIFGLYRGDLRRAAGHGDFVSRAYVDGERRVADAALAALAKIPRAALSPSDRIAWDTFAWTMDEWRERHSAPAANIWPLLKIDQQNGWHLFFPELSSGDGVVPYRTVADYDAGLARIDGFIGWLDRAVARMREGMATGVVQPRIVVERVIPQFALFAGQPLAESPYFRPIRHLPPDLPRDEAERLRAAYTAAIEQRLRPAFVRVQRFLADEYLRAARDTVGVGALPDGAAYYATTIREHTTLALGADEIHRLGLAEVERVGRGMAQVMAEVGFGGSRAQFFEMLRSDARFTLASAAAMTEAYFAIGRRVEATLPRLFDQRPATPLAIRPTPPESAENDAGARYTPGSPETGKPGVFHFNTHDLPSRRSWQMETLYLHEAVPGHHYETMLAAENAALPKLQRYVGNTAFSEGWALYAESLGFELGLFTDPYQRFGHYNDEMLRAMRLVVDTGLHHLGWSRAQAIDYMLANSAMTRVDVVSEVERYIVNPGQALAYKVGALTIQRLRREAGQALGTRFDLRAFHRQVLGTGGIPLAVLEAKVRGWIAAGA
jgi:uncharacterized protein (DUF885 family)